MSSYNPEVTKAMPEDLPRIFEVWESSVRATHDFLTEKDIQALIPLVKDGLAQFSPIYCLRDAEGMAFAFLGVEEVKIEMLFVHANRLGLGAGRALTRFAIKELGATLVDVNEQNDMAVGFYEHLGFRRFKRSALDPYGNPFPILHLELRPTSP